MPDPTPAPPDPSEPGRPARGPAVSGDAEPDVGAPGQSASGEPGAFPSGPAMSGPGASECGPPASGGAESDLAAPGPSAPGPSASGPSAPGAFPSGPATSRGSASDAGASGASAPAGFPPGDFDELFAALAEPTRRQLLDRIAAHGTATATVLAAELPVTRQAVVQHLAVLERVALVSSTRTGRERRYVVHGAPLTAAARWMTALAAQWDTRLDAIRRLAESPDP